MKIKTTSLKQYCLDIKIAPLRGQLCKARHEQQMKSMKPICTINPQKNKKFCIGNIKRARRSFRTSTADYCTQTSCHYLRRWWPRAAHHKARRAHGPSSGALPGALKRWLACWWRSRSSWSLSCLVPCLTS